MCPPPAEPIRPVGLWSDEAFVERAQRVARVVRRRPREEEDPDRERSHSDRHDDERSQLLRERWLGSASPLGEAGAYDDHGRPALPEDHDDTHSHVDRTA